MGLAATRIRGIRYRLLRGGAIQVWSAKELECLVGGETGDATHERTTSAGEWLSVRRIYDDNTTFAREVTRSNGIF